MTKEQVLNTFTAEDAAWWAYKQGLQEGFDEAYNSLRNQAAIAAMQGTITILSNRTTFTDIVVEGFRGGKKTYPNEIAQFSVACADALIEQLKVTNQ